jgi:uncharacterized protein (TIRG00374 family)
MYLMQAGMSERGRDPSRARDVLRGGIGAVVAVVCLYFAARDVPFSDLEDALRRLDVWWLAPAVGIGLLIQLLRAWRWQVELRPLARIDLASLWVMVSVAYMLINLLPLRVGEFVRPWLCARRSHVPMASVVGNLMLEKAMDSVVISLLFVLTLMTTPSLPAWVQGGVLVPVAAALALAVLVSLFLGRRGEVFERLALTFLPASSVRRLSGLAAAVADGLRVVPQPSSLATVFALSAALWLLPVLSSYVMIRAFAFDLPFQAALCVFVFISFGTALPQAPGMIGTYQYACVLALGLFGVPKSEALAYGLVLNAVQLGTLVVQGVIALSFVDVSLQDLARRPGRAALPNASRLPAASDA